VIHALGAREEPGRSVSDTLEGLWPTGSC
jgi:hypothetical protein